MMIVIPSRQHSSKPNVVGTQILKIEPFYKLVFSDKLSAALESDT
jgi:hypothetical protein